VPGLGDEAFVADGVLPASVLVARKGTVLVGLSSFAEVDPATGDFKGYLSAEQIVALARTMLSR
jgi:hypothetical protein